MLFALTREISPRFNECELTHLPRTPIDLDLARKQHHSYCSLLDELGCQVITLPAEDSMPDCVFVEDPAIVLENLAVITRPGAESRRVETESMEEALSPYRKIERIVAPGTIEGGDVIVVEKTIYVGRSSRSNDEGIVQLAALTAPYGYDVRTVQMSGCLHLKTGCSLVAPETLLVNRDWIDVGAFEDVDFIDAHPDEEYAGNALLIGENVIHPAAHEKTRAVLESRGINVTPVEYAELAKAESGVTCCSIIFESDWTPRLVG